MGFVSDRARSFVAAKCESIFWSLGACWREQVWASFYRRRPILVVLVCEVRAEQSETWLIYNTRLGKKHPESCFNITVSNVATEGRLFKR